MANPALRLNEFALVSPELPISKMKPLPLGAVRHGLFRGIGSIPRQQARQSR
jgi:hypothetical protein